MKKIFNCLLFSYLFTFIFMFNVNAECSYEERRELLNQAKNIEAYFEADINNNKFNFYLFNLTDDLYVNLENLSLHENFSIYKSQYNTEYYSMEEKNISEVFSYRLNIYSNKSECYSNKIISKSLKKGIINKYYKEDICRGIEEFKYCLPVLEKKISLNETEVYSKINEYRVNNDIYEKVEVNKRIGIDDLIYLVKKYWYVLAIFFGVVGASFIIYFIMKKRSEL